MVFKVGDRVCVSNRYFVSYKQTGTIHQRNIGGSYYVALDNGDYRCYKTKNLELIKTNIMEDQKMAITGDFKVAKIKFLNGTNTYTEYEYAMFDDYEVGDTVVVASANHGLGIAKISAIITKDQAVTKNFEREIVSKVDMETYEARKKNRNRLNELKNKMDKRFNELNKIALFEMMSEKDPELKSMLEEYKNLIGV